MAVNQSAADFRVGDWVVRPSLGRIEHATAAAHLTPRAMAVLVHLAANNGAVVSRNELLDAVWPRMAVSHDALSQCIVELRKAFGDDSRNPSVIETIPKIGVRLVLPITPVPTDGRAPTNEAGAAGGMAARAPVAIAARSRRLPVFAAIAVALAAIGVAVWDPSPTPAPQRSIPAPGSVAVLPFDNLSPNPDDSYLAEGIHEEILTQLAKIKALSVVSRTSVLRYADSTLSVPELGAELNVAALLEGSVRFDADRIRVSVQLVDAAADRRLWAETYEHELENIFGIQSDIAANVANALEAEYSAAERARIAVAPTESVEAYALYLRATQAGRPTAVAYLEQAIEIDPGFAAAYAALSQRHAFELTNTNTFDGPAPDERAAIEAKADTYARRAIELDPDVPYAYTALAVPAYTSWHWTEAEAALARAIAVAPNDLTARNVYCALLAALGRHDEALGLGRRAVELNPGNPNAAWYGYWLAAAGAYDEAAAAIEGAIAVNPTNLLDRTWLAFVEIARGKNDIAIEQLELAERIAGTDRLVALLVEWAYSYGRLGRESDAERIFREIESGAARGRQPGPGGWAVAYLAIGDEKRALEALETSAARAARHERDEGFYNLMNLKMNVTDDPRLRQPEFVRVLSAIKGD